MSICIQSTGSDCFYLLVTNSRDGLFLWLLRIPIFLRLQWEKKGQKHYLSSGEKVWYHSVGPNFASISLIHTRTRAATTDCVQFRPKLSILSNAQIESCFQRYSGSYETGQTNALCVLNVAAFWHGSVYGTQCVCALIRKTLGLHACSIAHV